MSFREMRQKIKEKRRMKDVKLETDYIQIGDLFGLLDLQEKQLRSLEPTCKLTNEEIHEFLYAEDDRGEIFRVGKEQGRIEIIEKILVEKILGVDSDKKE